jgi:hypothetical protein
MDTGRSERCRHKRDRSRDRHGKGTARRRRAASTPFLSLSQAVRPVDDRELGRIAGAFALSGHGVTAFGAYRSPDAPLPRIDRFFRARHERTASLQAEMHSSKSRTVGPVGLPGQATAAVFDAMLNKPASMRTLLQDVAAGCGSASIAHVSTRRCVQSGPVKISMDAGELRAKQKNLCRVVQP